MGYSTNFDIFENINFHDSSILNFKLINEDRVEIVVRLYDVFYPETTIVSVSICGIFNFTTVSSFFSKLQDIWKDEQDIELFFGRINSFHLDKNKHSSDDNRWI